jgi:ureidoglycolate dehydrogenase (NAD+)
MTIEGTVSRTIGNNPMAIGAQGPDFPLVLDMATSVASLGRVHMWRGEGKPLPAEWVVGGVDRAQDVVLRHFGGAKGSGLAIMLEVLSGVLSGAGPHRLMTYDARKESDGAVHTQIAIDAQRLSSPARWEQNIRELVARLRSADRAPGVDEVRLPGERAWQETLKRRRDGIPIDPGTVKALDDIAREVGTSVPWE